MNFLDLHISANMRRNIQYFPYVDTHDAMVCGQVLSMASRLILNETTGRSECATKLIKHNNWYGDLSII